MGPLAGPREGVVTGMELIRPRSLRDCGAAAAFTTRAGGVSSGPYALLNMGLHVGDDPECVLENRRRVARELGLDAGDLTAAVQVHGGSVGVVEGLERGRGALSWEDGLEATDALVTAEPGLPLLVVAADCLLAALGDAGSGVVAAVHASRRSALAGIVAATVEAMRALGAEPGRTAAVLGPHIGECCYEVGPEVESEAAEALGPRSEGLFSPAEGAGGRRRFRLSALVRQDLRAAGVSEANIEQVGGCTACEADRFYSYRRDGARTGRNALIVWNAHREAQRHG